MSGINLHSKIASAPSPSFTDGIKKSVLEFGDQRKALEYGIKAGLGIAVLELLPPAALIGLGVIAVGEIGKRLTESNSSERGELAAEAAIGLAMPGGKINRLSGNSKRPVYKIQ